MRVPKIKTPLVNIPERSGQGRAFNTSLGAPRLWEGNSSWAFGANKWDPIIKGTDDVSRAVEAISIDLLKKQDEAAVNEAYTQLGEGLNDFLHGEGGIYSRHGSKAMGSAGELKSFFAEIQPKLSKGMSKNAHSLFAQKADDLRMANAKSVALHEAEELQIWRFDSLKGSAQTNKNLALASFGDDKVFTKAQENFQQDLLNIAEIKGMSEEGTKALLAKEMSGLNRDRVSLIAQNGDTAGAFYLAQNSHMSDVDRAQARKLIADSVNKALLASARTEPEGTANAIMERFYQTGDPHTPQGIKNNNPGNIRIKGDKGANAQTHDNANAQTHDSANAQIHDKANAQTHDNANAQTQGQEAGEDGALLVFKSPEAGIKAMGQELINKIDSGSDTLEKLLSDYASDPGGRSNIHFVAQRLGLSPNASLNSQDIPLIFSLVSSLILMENGGNPYSEEQIFTGVTSAIENSELPDNLDNQDFSQNSLGFYQKDTLNPKSEKDLLSSENVALSLKQSNKVFSEQLAQEFNAFIDKTYYDVYTNSQGLDLELRDYFMLNVFSQLPDIYRDELLKKWDKDKVFLERKQKAFDATLGYEVLQKLKTDKYSYSESISIAHSLKEKGMSNDGINKLIVQIDGAETLENPDNI